MTGSPQPSSNVRVVARIRPLTLKEERSGSKETVTSMQHRVGNLDNRLNWASSTGEPELIETTGTNLDGCKRWFELDAVFDKSSTQEEVYIRSGASRAVRDDIFIGHNVTILAYGQTGAGKTHTMGTAARGGVEVLEEDGVIPRACADLVKTMNEKCHGNAKVELSYMEIYNEEIRDLLATDNKTHLRIRETSNGEIYVSGLETRTVSTPRDIGKLMQEASRRRVVAATAMNAVSSRSHAICILNIRGEIKNIEKNQIENFTSKLTLVDLAGSERIKKTGAKGNRKQEGININKGLFVLGQVISALSEQGQKEDKAQETASDASEQGRKKNCSTRMPPYRDSKLTRILQDSLGGNSRTIMIACVSPAEYNVEESVNTLRYATSARNIKNKVTSNIERQTSSTEAAALRRENQLLKDEVAKLQAALGSMSSAPGFVQAIPVETLPNIHSETAIAIHIDNRQDQNWWPNSAERDPALELASSKYVDRPPLGNSSPRHDSAQESNGEERSDASSTRPVETISPSLLLREVQKSKKLQQENDKLRQVAEDARADADSARLVAAKLSDVIDQLQELKRDDIDKRKVELNHMQKEEAWVLFVDSIVDARAEQMVRLTKTFDLVVRVLDSPAVMQTRQKRTWFGKGGVEEFLDPELREQVLREHVNFFHEKMQAVQLEIVEESQSLKQMRESIQQDCSELQAQIASDEEVCDNWKRNRGPAILKEHTRSQAWSV